MKTKFAFLYDIREVIVVTKNSSSDGRVVIASASRVVESGLIPSQIKPMTLILVFTASLLDAQQLRDSVKNKPASLLVVPLGRAF